MEGVAVRAAPSRHWGLKASAERLLSIAQHKTIKEQVQLAVRDLDEGLVWLQQKNIDDRAPLLRIVDLTKDLARHRLQMVEHALKTYAPNAMLVG